MKHTIDNDTYNMICRALEATQKYAARELSPRESFNPELLKVDLMVADALELLDKDIAA